MFRLYRTTQGLMLEQAGAWVSPTSALTLDSLFQATAPLALVQAAFATGRSIASPVSEWTLLAPLQSQEVWAAGVTYLRSKSARMAESKEAGGGSFYDRVYDAERPELFFKATPHRVAAPGGEVRIRRDSRWNVPEPELTLALNAAGQIFGYTIGNDMSSRDIEGENPLYLPQAKTYDLCAALGPCLVIADTLPSPATAIALEIRRAGRPVFQGETTVACIKRPLPSLADWLFRESSFPAGAYLMTGTGVIPPDDFTLAAGDEVRISLDPVGTLVNRVAAK
jgi:2-dehydro-3-deoxy-D-arabinonate dehydratase